MSSILAAHRAALATLLSGVDGAGLVHLEEPYAKTQAAFQALYQWANPATGEKQVRGWFLHRLRTQEQELGVGRVMNVHTWRVRGFMALLPPASGQAFDELIESMRDAFRADPTLGGVAQPGPVGQPSGVQVVESGPVVFSGVLCHSAQLELKTWSFPS